MPRGKAKDRDGVFTRKDRPGHFYGSWIDSSGRRRKRKCAHIATNMHTGGSQRQVGSKPEHERAEVKRGKSA